MKTQFHALRGTPLRTWLFTAMVAVGLVTTPAWAQSDHNSDPAADTGSDPATDTSTTADPAAPVNTTPGQLTVQLSGTATANNETELQITPPIFDTGLIEIGSTTSQTVMIKHAGSADAPSIQINEAELFGGTPEEYSVDFNGYTTLFPGDEVAVNVTFTPAYPGDKSAGLRMNVDGLTAPVVMMFKGKTRYPLTSDLLNSADTINFGQTLAGSATTKTLTLTNDGDPTAPAVNINSFTLSGQNPNSFESNFAPTTLQPGATLNIVVTLKNNVTGFNQALATIEHDGNNDAIEIMLEGTKTAAGSVPISFSTSKLNGASITRGTAAQFGPDGKFYVTEMNGAIKIYDIQRNGKNNYAATLTQTINSISETPNHNDDGTAANLGNKRLVTGILVVGTAANPIIYVASSDPRQAAGPSGTDSGLDTNSGILHKLTKNGNTWVKQDLVRGLPRSEENHVPNGMVLQGNTLYLITGGHTNEGAPSNNFAFTPEYALSAAVLTIDLGAIGNSTYDLPTLDDEDRPGVNDANDPFGGNDGKNQAKLIPTSPVKVFSTGYRNAYDLVMHSNGKMYTFDNGPNPPWGGAPIGNCSNQVSEGGGFHPDQLHLVSQGSYAGHANPTRGNKSNTFNASNPQTPIEGPAMPADCNYKAAGQGDGSLTTILGSTNGMTEYTASNFFGQLQGDLIVSSFNKKITRVVLTPNGNGVASKQVLLDGYGTAPLDITSQGDNDPFPGTMWIIDNLDTQITVMEPSDY